MKFLLQTKDNVYLNKMYNNNRPVLLYRLFDENLYNAIFVSIFIVCCSDQHVGITLNLRHLILTGTFRYLLIPQKVWFCWCCCYQQILCSIFKLKDHGWFVASLISYSLGLRPSSEAINYQQQQYIYQQTIQQQQVQLNSIRDSKVIGQLK